jgi:ABC-type branched-subunit amino acid transport system substrate-binding protein
MSLSLRLPAAVSAVAIAIGSITPLVAQEVPELDLRFGVLAGMSGDLAQSGQPWSEAVRLGVEDLAMQVESWGYADKIKISFVGAEDSQGNAQGGIEAAKKLVGVNGANIVVGDFFSSVTVAAAQSVFIPEEVIDFTGGTAPSITDLNKSTGATWVWRMAPPDSIQGPVVAKLIADTLGADATLNVAARNDTYGVGLLDAFKQAWTAGGGKIGSETVYNPDAPTLDTEAQQIASGNPDGWFLVSFCGDWGKLKGPLQRTGTWDPKRTFGGDALGGCPVPNETLAGMRNTRGDVSGGGSNSAWVELFNERANENVPFASWSVEAFDTPYIAFLAALAAGSSDTNAIREQLPAVTSAPGVKCDFTTLKTCVDAILAGEDVDFDGGSGEIAFDEFGDPSIVSYVILESQGDGAIDDPVIGRVTLGAE